MRKIPTDTCVDIELFQNDLKDINPEFIPSIVSIFKMTNTNKEISFLFMTDDATYAYGKEICKWLSLKHDPKRPKQINILKDKKIIQVDSGHDFVAVLTDDGLVYLASGDSNWQTNNTFRLISNGNDRFEMIACGWGHLLLLRQDGTVFALGDNEFGQLTGNSESSYVTVVNTGLNNVKIIACGAGHSLALTNTNEIYSWGWNENGQLGLGDTNNRRTPSLVSFPDGSIDSPIKNIVAGARHSLFLLEDGQIFGCGYGQCPINDNEQDAKVPTKIPIENVQSMACKNHRLISYALDHSSHYYEWGTYNHQFLPLKKLDGQLKSFVAASIMSYKSPITFGLTSTIYSFESHDTITNIELFNNPDNYDIEFIIGDKRILACKCYLKMSSEYYNRMFSGEWLENDQVIIKDYNYDVYYSYLLMLHSGRIRINQSNIAILIDLANCYGDERLMKHCKTFIRRDLNKQTLCIYLPLINKYELDGMNDKLVELTIKDVLCALHFVIFVCIVQQIIVEYCFLLRTKLAFQEKKTMKTSPTDTDVDIELFQNDLKDIDHKFIRNIVSIFKITQFFKEIGFLCMTNDATYVYGEEICKWLSLQHDPKRPQQMDILNDKKIIQVDSGEGFVVVLTDDGLVYLASCDSRWKTNNTFRLISTGDDRFQMIACGMLHLLLLRQDGTVFALGDNKYGQLTGNSSSSYDTVVNTGLNNVKMIACGESHSLALTNTNEIYSWGYNNYGQLGLGDTNVRRTPSLVSFPDGSINSQIKNIVAGLGHSLFLLEDGQIFGCGYGQNPINDNEPNAKVPTKIPIENVQSMACKNNLFFSLALDQSSRYYEWCSLNTKELNPIKKLDGQLKSFAAASVMQYKSLITFGLTSTFYTYKSNDTISNIGLLDNPDNYDIEFVIDDKRILASKCYLRMVSKYYSRMFSGDWQENNQVIIKDYSYDIYYSYLVMLHTGRIRINQSNIAELIDLANCYGDEQLMKHCRTFIQTDLNEQTLSIYFPLIDKYELDEMHDKLCFSRPLLNIVFFAANKTKFSRKKTMKIIPTDTEVDIELFRNDLRDIDPEFIPNIVSVFKMSLDRNNFLFMTNDSTYAYGYNICEWILLEHDPKRPQRIDIFNGKKIIQVDSGCNFVVVLTDDGLVYLANSEDSEWPMCGPFELIFTGNDRFEMIACGWKHLLLLRQDGTVFAFGDNKYGQLTGDSESSYDVAEDTILNNVKMIACGSEHSLALTNTNQIYSWGYNKYGQLGLGDTNNRRTPSLVSFPDGSINSQIKNIVAGDNHSLFLLEDGQIFGCGYGQRPINDKNPNAKVPTKIPIENVQSVACKNDLSFSFALDHSSHYYQWGKFNKELVFEKLDGQPTSFSVASVKKCVSPVTFGLTSTFYTYKSYDPTSIIGLLDNPDNYDFEFIIGDKRILACKCFLKMASKFYSRMFSFAWQESNNRVVIDAYSYDVYYSYLRMLHTGQMQINRFNIAELIDLANCYCDEQLMKQCQTFMQIDLN
ncbi:RCC1 and BTB domain-containing protein 1 [Dermatophagoides pteronyssinus]|uniref:RCC1 and BTB domain-containing protein 1 n=1 Tax=Dermatophagoides pteronyssinus TaxID=6956 RepID=A0ABQ8IVG2_DERPT|nr:RCC1 and BTB domain-containing protein 1 [Dermatophagoides pteronyssinus]